MANKIVKMCRTPGDDFPNEISHEYGYDSISNTVCIGPIEVDKSKTISDMTNLELQKLIDRLRSEMQAENIIRDLRRSSGAKDTYENPAVIDTTTPINQLYHHGILGQKWGVRRFQNKDGSRTSAGKKRDGEKDYDESDDHVKSRAQKMKATSGLSNDELRKLNERLQLESTYKNLTAEKIQKSESFVKKAIRDAGGQALTEFSKGVFLGSAKLLVKEISPSFAETAFNIKDKKKD